MSTIETILLNKAVEKMLREKSTTFRNIDNFLKKTSGKSTREHIIELRAEMLERRREAERKRQNTQQQNQSTEIFIKTVPNKPSINTNASWFVEAEIIEE